MDPFPLHNSDDNEKNTFNNGHGLKYVTCKQTFILVYVKPMQVYALWRWFNVRFGSNLIIK